MKKLNKDRRNYLIIGLCAILVVMAVGYAAFASQLTINGTSETTSTWNIRITDIAASRTATNTGTEQNPVYASTGSISSSVANDGLSATFDTALVTPGDEVIYEVEVSNLGSLDATVSSTISPISGANDPILITYEETSSTSLLSGSTYSGTSTANQSSIPDFDLNKQGATDSVKYIYIKVKYNPNVESQPETTTASTTITLNAIQKTSGSGGVSGGGEEPVDSGYYVFATGGHNIGDPYTPTSAEGEWPTGRNIALKYVLDGSGNIAEAYACTKFSGLTDPVCLRGGTENGENPSNFYSANQATIASVQALPEYSGSGVSCSSAASDPDCSAGDLGMDASDHGDAHARDHLSGNVSCDVYASGYASCTEW